VAAPYCELKLTERVERGGEVAGSRLMDRLYERRHCKHSRHVDSTQERGVLSPRPGASPRRAPARDTHAAGCGRGYQRPAKRTENRQKYTTLYKSFWSKMKIQVAAVSEPRGQTRDVYVF
jgi:hypothetical protein